MIVLVTGASGFIGSHVLDALLAQNKAVRALVRDPAGAEGLRARGAEVFVGDVRDPRVLQDAVRTVGAVYHCAAAVGNGCSRQEIYDVNLTGVRNLLEAVRQAGTARVVLLSSINVLGTCRLDSATEDMACRRSNDPAADVKIEAERLALDYHRRHYVDMTIVRPGFVYGPRDRHNLPKLIGALRRGKFAFIGSRDHVIPIVYVTDVAQMMLAAAGVPAARGRVYHAVHGSRTTIGEFIDYLAEHLRCPPPRKVLPYVLPYAACVLFEQLARFRLYRGKTPIARNSLRFLGTSRCVDIRRAREELGYVPRVSYREGVAAALRWIEEHSDDHPNDARARAGKHAGEGVRNAAPPLGAAKRA